MESIAKKIKIACIERDTNVTKLAAKLGLSKENFHAQLKRDNFRVTDIEKIANALDYNVKISFIDKVEVPVNEYTLNEAIMRDDINKKVNTASLRDEKVDSKIDFVHSMPEEDTFYINVAKLYNKLDIKHKLRKTKDFTGQDLVMYTIGDGAVPDHFLNQQYDGEKMYEALQGMELKEEIPSEWLNQFIINEAEDGK